MRKGLNVELVIGPLPIETRNLTQVTKTEYYPCRVRLEGQDRYLAWYTSDIDGFLRAPDGRLIIADNPESLGVTLAGVDPVEYDFDRIREWCAASNSAEVDCPEFLNAWNFFDDLTGLHAKSESPHTRLSRAAGRVYDKLFWGNNLPAVTPSGERFDPSWSPEELAKIREVFESGLAVLTAELVRGLNDQSIDDTK